MYTIFISSHQFLQLSKLSPAFTSFHQLSKLSPAFTSFLQVSPRKMSCTGFVSAAAQYEYSIAPMVPAGNDANFDATGVPFIGWDHRAMINQSACDYGVYDHAGNFHINYSCEDLLEDIHGLELAVWGDRDKELKELQAHKDLLDQVAFLVSIDEMTDADLKDTQDSVHAALKDGHNRYYHFFDLRQFPGNFIRDPSTGLIGRAELCTFLRKNHKVWYVSFQGNRVVAMGSRYLELVSCMAKLHEELRRRARGEWSNRANMTARCARRRPEMERLYDLEMANSDLISETWGMSIEETKKILTNSYYEEFNQEEALRIFACTGRLPIDNESIYC